MKQQLLSCQHFLFIQHSLFSALTMGIIAKPWEHMALLGESTFVFWAIINSLATGLIANILFLRGLSMNVDASKVTIITSVEVIVASLSGVLLLNEQINLVGFIGIVLMMFSIVGMNVDLPVRAKGKPDVISSLESR